MDRPGERLTAEERDAKMREKMERILNAPPDKPITIDKGHERPIYGDVAEPLEKSKLSSKEFAGLPKEEQVRALIEEHGLTERGARQFLAIGRGESPGDQREPLGRGPAAPR